MANTIGKLLVELGLDDADFRNGIKGAASALETLQKGGVEFSNTLDNLVTGSLKAAGAAFAAFGAVTLKTGADFEQAITTVRAISGATEGEFVDLTNKARELGATTKYTATEAATAMQDLAQAGLTVNQVLSASGPALVFAAGAGTDMATSTALTAATLSQFGLDASQAARIADVFSVALKDSLFDVESLREAMKYGGTVGAGFGYSLEETTAAIAQFRNLGLEGSMAGTQFRMAMSAAATTTEDSRRVLAKYNLTAKDINPELHSFAEIMETIGKSAMTTTDALQVFGTRSGANVIQVARAFQDTTTGYYKLLDSMKDSSGQAQILYDTMTNTVSGKFEEALSSFEELMLSMFDTMKGPLRDLLVEIAATVSYVAEVFNRESGSIGDSFSSMVTEAIEYLKTNREAIAVGFVDFVRSLRDVVTTLAQMIPMLITLGKVMLTVWVADKVRIFVSAIHAGITALAGMAGGIRAVMVALTAASGGLYAVVAAIGTVVAAIIYFTSSTAAAEAATERLRAAEERLAKAKEDRAKRERAAADALAAQQALNLSQTELALQAEGNLGSELEQQIGRLQGLSSASIEAGLASGQLFEATLGGTKVVLDHDAALRLQFDATSKAEDAATSYKVAVDSATTAVSVARRDAEGLAYDLKNYDIAVRDGATSTVAFNAFLSQYGDTVEDARALQQDYNGQLAESRKKLAGLRDGLELAKNSLLKVEAAKERSIKSSDRLSAAEGRSGRAARDSADEAKRAYEARVKAVQRVEDAIERRRASEEELAAIEMKQQIAELDRLFDAEIAAYKKQTEKIKAAEIERSRITAVVRADAAEQLQREQDKILTEIDIAIAAASRDAAAQERYETDKRHTDAYVALRKKFEAERLLYEKGSLEQYEVMLRWAQESQKLDELKTVQLLKIVRERYAEIAKVVEQLELEQGESRLNELDKIELERAKVLVANEGATGEQLRQINAVFNAKTLEQKKKLTDEVILLTAGEYKEVVQLTRERDALLFQLGEDQIEERKKVIKYYDEAIKKATKEAEKNTKTSAKKMAEALGVVRDAAWKVAKAIAKGIGSAISGVVGLFGKMTGFSFDLFSATSNVRDAMKETADLQAQLAAGEISPQEYEQAVGELPANAQSAAVNFVTELVEGARTLLSTFVSAAPALIEELALQLPRLINEFARALPAATMSLTRTIPALVQAVVEQVPFVIGALASSIDIIIGALSAAFPQLVQDFFSAVLALLPTILQSLLQIGLFIIQGAIAALPQLLLALTEAINAIVPMLVQIVLNLVQVLFAQLPSILGALTTGLMQIVTMLLQQVGVLVSELAKMMPQIVAAVMDAAIAFVEAIVAELPTIIESLIVAAYQIGNSVIAMLPSLIASFVSLLPQLIRAIVALIPAIVQGFVNALPKVLSMLIQMIPQLIIAFFTEFIPALGQALPEIIYEVTVGLISAVAEALAILGRGIGETLYRFFSDVFEELATVGVAETATFGDTPGAVRAGAEGMAARFAPGDYVVAAQRPADLLRQAMDAMRGEMAASVAPAARGYAPGEMDVPAAAGLAAAMLQAASAMREGMAGAGGPAAGQRLQVVVQANGRTLDDALFTSERRGDAPRLSRELRRTTLRTGVHVGFDRGKFTQ